MHPATYLSASQVSPLLSTPVTMSKVQRGGRHIAIMSFLPLTAGCCYNLPLNLQRIAVEI